MQKVSIITGLLLALVISLISLISLNPAAAVVKTANAANSTARAVIAYYGDHNKDIDNRLKQIRPALLVTSTPNDYWHSANALKDVIGMQKLGIKVFGFTTASYETMDKVPGGRTQEQCIRDIMVKDGTDGVFMDQSSGQLDDAKIQYHRRYAQLVHSYGKLYYVNPGYNDIDERWFTEIGADFVNGTEHWYASGYPNTAYDPSSIQTKFASRCTVIGFPLGTINEARTAIMDAYAHGIAYAYINNHFFLTVSDYWDTLANELRNPLVNLASAQIGGPASEKVIVQYANLTETGWLVLHPSLSNGKPDMSVTLGKMYLNAGTYNNLAIEINTKLAKGSVICMVTHKDDPGDQVFGFTTKNTEDQPVKKNNQVVMDYIVIQ